MAAREHEFGVADSRAAQASFPGQDLEHNRAGGACLRTPREGSNFYRSRVAHAALSCKVTLQTNWNTIESATMEKGTA